MIIGTALALPAGATVALSIALAFFFGYPFTCCRCCAPA